MRLAQPAGVRRVIESHGAGREVGEVLVVLEVNGKIGHDVIDERAGSISLRGHEATPSEGAHLSVQN